MEEVFICVVCCEMMKKNEVAGKVHIDGKINYYCRKHWNEWKCS